MTPVLLCFTRIRPRPPGSTLFPYTTLFRSGDRRRCSGASRAAAPANHLAYCCFGSVSLVHRFRVVLSALGQQVPLETRSEEHTSELQSQFHLVCRLLLEKKKPSLKRGWALV